MDDGGAGVLPEREEPEPRNGIGGSRGMIRDGGARGMARGVEEIFSMVLDEPRGRPAPVRPRAGAGRVPASPAEPAAEAMRRAAPSPDEVAALTQAVLDPGRERRDEVIERLRARGAADAALVEVHVPAAARRLGEMWLDDTASFVEVTMAVASLQGLVRDLTPRPDPVLGADARAPLVAVIVRDRETHTLGASVAAARLRRGGASVMLLMGRPDGQVVEAVREGGFSAVCVSASAREDLAGLAGLIGRLRSASRAPVLLGGSILEDGAGGRGDGRASLRVATGADHVTSDPGMVLRLCGLVEAAR